MSTALVSPFYDVGDILLNQKNMLLQQAKTQLRADTRAVGTPLNGTQLPQLRRHSTSTTGTTSPITANHLNGNTLSNSLYTQQTLEAVFNKENINLKPRDRALSESDRNSQQAAARNQNSSRYKTELCRPFEENGTCKYGDKCQFAHGIQELRSLSRHPKYKTELCRTFHTVGFCPYGPRCHFIHNPDERKLAAAGPPKSHDSPIERPKLLHFNSAPLGLSTGGDLSPPPMSICDSPLPLTPPPSLDHFPSQDELLATLTNNAMYLNQVQQELAPILSPSALSPTSMQNPFSSVPSSPFTPLQPINDDLEHLALRQPRSTRHHSYSGSVFFPQDEPAPVNIVSNNHHNHFRPPSPPESLSDPESIPDTNMTSTSPTPGSSSPLGLKLGPGRLPIFRGMSQEDQMVRF